MPAEARTTRTETPAVAQARAARAHATRAAMFERAAERVVALDWGSAIYHDRFPGHPDLNTVRVEVPAPGLDAERLHGAVERLQRGLPHRRVEVFDEDTARAVQDGMLARGYEPGHSVLMGWDRGEPPVAPAVEEVPYPAVERLREEWLRGDWEARSADRPPIAARSPDRPPIADLVAQGLAGDRATFAATPTRAFAVIRDGRPVAYGLLLDLGEAALVEDVYTTPAARGAGLGTAVVHRLVWESRRGGHDDTVLATDASGRARELYARLGFRPLAVVHRFLHWSP